MRGHNEELTQLYYPCFHGKTFELVTIRAMASLLADKQFVPVIEPVRKQLGYLQRALKAVCDAGGSATLIVNPYHGDHQQDGAPINTLLKQDFKGAQSFSAGILLRRDMTVDQVMAYCDQYADRDLALIHAGFNEPKTLAARLCKWSGLTHVFLEHHAKLLYQKHFDESKTINQNKHILVRDGFKRLRNADYKKEDEFSDLHVTYRGLGMDGFGDFLTVGDVYSEGEGPAYAVAIHLTYIDPNKDHVMGIRHFVSDNNTSPIDPAGKFAEALKHLIATLESKTSHLLETEAIKEFRAMHANGHFPGLGYVKKLSMQHHIETLANFLA